MACLMRFIDFRIADADYERIREAARPVGFAISKWLRQRLQEAASREPAWRYSTPVIPSTRVVDVKRNKRRGDARHHLGQRGTAHPSSYRGGHHRRPVRNLAWAAMGKNKPRSGE